MERAVKLAPDNGLFRLDAVKAAAKHGQKNKEEEHRRAAQEALGEHQDKFDILLT
jgi:hypothetical protein